MSRFYPATEEEFHAWWPAALYGWCVGIIGVLIGRYLL